MAAASTPPGQDSSTGSHSSSRFLLNNRVLSIDLQHGPKTDLRYTLIPIQGSPPREAPTFYVKACSYSDARGLDPFTIQFISSEPDDLYELGLHQDGVRDAVWTSLGDLLSGCPLPESLPTITFDKCNLRGKDSHSVLSLNFPSSDAFDCVDDNLIKIDVQRSRGKSCSYEVSRVTNGVPGRFLRIDCVGLPLDTIDLEALSTALTDMTSAIGTLAGISKMIAYPTNSRRQIYTGTSRCYVELARRWMSAPLENIVATLPTLLRWEGLQYRLLYVGYKQHKQPVLSADYPLINDASVQGPSTNSTLQTGDPAGAASAAVGKKRKTPEQ